MSIEEQFSSILEGFRLNQQGDPFEIISSFKQISANQAISVGEKLQSDPQLLEEFENWDLETKLWDLVDVLYRFRASVQLEPLDEYEFSSLAVKQENFLIKNPNIRELGLVIHWLQSNSRSVDLPIIEGAKWGNTGKDLDADAPIRTNTPIHPEDITIDEQNFYTIYKLLLVNKIGEAIEVANSTGNFSLALILSGTQEYTDPIIDGLSEGNPSAAPSGIKHKLLWLKTVYNLSKKATSPSERMIYNFLSGGDISLNLKEAGDDWEESLLLYTYQLYNYSLENFISKGENITPRPRYENIGDILNSLLKKNTGPHPLRVILGGVIINLISTLLGSIVSSINDESIKPYLTRIITHLSLFEMILGNQNATEDITTIITLYISKLSDYNLPNLIPIYISFIPNEIDGREIYSLFLSTITEPEQRKQQLRIFRKLQNPLTTDEDFVMIDDSNSSLINVLRRTVERVVIETEDYYTPQKTIQIQDTPGIDDTDFKLYRSVEWFYDNEMYEDAILATITVIRRFLLNGKLTSLKAFTKDKNFRKLIRDHDSDLHAKLLTNDQFVPQITEEHNQELLEYSQLVDGLNLISDWREFVTTQNTLWEPSGVSKSIEKTTAFLRELAFSWLKDGIELRTTYAPFLVIELLNIYQSARLKDWKYMKEAFALINDVADESKNDLLGCFIRSGRLDEFLVKAGEVSVVAVENGVSGIFA